MMVRTGHWQMSHSAKLNFRFIVGDKLSISLLKLDICVYLPERLLVKYGDLGTKVDCQRNWLTRDKTGHCFEFSWRTVDLGN